MSNMLQVENIVVVEDDLIIRMFITNTLKKLGFKIVGEARDGQKAIELAREQKPDLMLMDIGITGDIDGIETAHKIAKTQSIPIVFLTGNSDKATLNRAHEANPLKVLFKPIDDHSLRIQLLEVCEVKP